MKNIIKTIIIGIGVIITICIVSFLVWAFWFVANFHGDTYKSAETYIIQTSGESLLEKIHQFKTNNPEYILIKENRYGEKEIQEDRKDEYRPNFYHVNFYLQDYDLGISCVLDFSNNSKKSSLGLYVVSEGSRFAKWQRINNDKEISREKSQEIKKKFETDILDKLGVKWRHKRWYE